METTAPGEIFAIDFATLAREIAMDIFPLEQILVLHQLSSEEWATIQAHPRFISMLTSMQRDWQSAQNTRERVKVKSATGLESMLEVYIRDINDADIPLNQRVEAGKFLAKLGELDAVRNAGRRGRRGDDQHRHRQEPRADHHRGQGYAAPHRGGMIRWIVARWRRHQRWTDVSILWPSCIEGAVDRAHAEMAFRLHMELDPAYSDMDEAERERFVRELP